MTNAAIDKTEVNSRDVIALVAFPSFAVSICENIYHSAHVGLFASQPWGPKGLTIGPYVLLSILLLYPTVAAIRNGREGVLAGLAGFALAIWTVHVFRGALYWPGVFDRQGEPKTHLIGPFAVVAFLGFGVTRVRSIWPTPSQLYATSVVTGLLALALGFVHLIFERGLDSAFVYSRPYAIGTLLAVVVLWPPIEVLWQMSHSEEVMR